MQMNLPPTQVPKPISQKNQKASNHSVERYRERTRESTRFKEDLIKVENSTEEDEELIKLNQEHPMTLTDEQEEFL